MQGREESRPFLHPMNILFFGDIIGKLGRKALVKELPNLKKEFQPDVTIANVENLTHGVGISPSAIEELDRAGIDAFTSGNHIWGNPAGLPILDDPAWTNRLVRPANMRRDAPGKGSTIFTTKDGIRLLLINLSGALSMPSEEPIENPFHALDTILAAHAPDAPHIILVDIHAELTAEKEALGHYADGRVSAVIGTHTHVQTSDARILPNGTAYCTDAGRVGAHDSVLGFEKSSVIERFLKSTKTPYQLNAAGIAEIDGALIRVDLKTGRALAIETFRRILEISDEKG